MAELSYDPLYYSCNFATPVCNKGIPIQTELISMWYQYNSNVSTSDYILYLLVVALMQARDQMLFSFLASMFINVILTCTTLNYNNFIHKWVCQKVDTITKKHCTQLHKIRCIHVKLIFQIAEKPFIVSLFLWRQFSSHKFLTY